jgi:hypothetical protein
MQVQNCFYYYSSLNLLLANYSSGEHSMRKMSINVDNGISPCYSTSKINF